MANSPDPEIRRLLGVEGDLGRRLGLDPDWAARAIAQVGNYGEIFERNLGTDTPLGMERGLNDLWTEGGLMSAPPFRLNEESPRLEAVFIPVLFSGARSSEGEPPAAVAGGIGKTGTG